MTKRFTNPMPDATRRRVLTALGLLTGCVVLPAAAVAGSAGGATSTTPTQDADVLVIGAGTAGLSAAIAAREAGAERVLILEKLPITGGHGIYSSGSVAVARRRPEAADPDRDIRLMTEEILALGDGEADPILAQTLAEGSEAAVEWLRGMGVRWASEPFRAVGGLTARNISTGTPQSGYDYVTALVRRARELQIEIFHGHRAVALLSEPDKTGRERITGVEVLLTRGAPRQTVAANPEREDVSDANIMRFHAPAVVLATGGFGANVGMRQLQNPELDARFRTTVDPRGFFLDGATGDGIRMAERLGAKTVGMQHIQVIPYAGGRLLDYVGGEIWVNDEGKRFVSEGLPFGELQKVLHMTEGRSFWAISDANTPKGATFGVKLAEGTVREAPSIDAMARDMGVPAAALKETIERWNESVRLGRDLDFGIPMTGVPIHTPPFFYGRESWSVHFSGGGLAIDAKARVLRPNESYIAGLFAAGETTGGIHGADRVGGASLTDTFVFGRIAGRSAARYAATVRSERKE